MKNGLTTLLLLFFFFWNVKNLGRWNDAKRNKKRGWPNVLCKHRFASVLLPLFSIRMYLQRMSSQNSPLFSNITTNLN